VNASHKIQPLVLVLLSVCMMSVPMSSVRAQTIPHLTVTLTGQALTAGFNNNVTVTVVDNYYNYPAIYDVDVAVAIPAGLAMYGGSHWHYDTMQLGQLVAIDFQVYAPTAAIGSAYQGTITVTYKALGDVSYTQEVHSVSFSVYAYISLTLYGIQVTPSTSTPGGNATISGNLLNSGNLAVYDANVTAASDITVQSALSSSFLGEIDPNIPRPFSLVVVFKGNVAPGNYSIQIDASAIDNGRAGTPYTAQATADVQLRRQVLSPNQGRGGGAGGVLGILLEILRYLEGIFFGSTSNFSFGHPLMLSMTDCESAISLCIRSS
jgi:hypothetical protein